MASYKEHSENTPELQLISFNDDDSKSVVKTSDTKPTGFNADENKTPFQELTNPTDEKILSTKLSDIFIANKSSQLPCDADGTKENSTKTGVTVEEKHSSSFEVFQYVGPDPIDWVIKFDPTFAITEIILVNSTKALIFNTLKLMLIDIEKQSVLVEYNMEEYCFSDVQYVNDDRVLFRDLMENKVVQFDLKTKTSHNLIDVNYDTNNTFRHKINGYMVRKSGDIILFVTKKETRALLSRYVSYIQLYTIIGSFVREHKCQQDDENVIGDVVATVESKNGNICVIAEKGTDANSKYVVVLDSNFELKICYEGNTLDGSTFLPTSIATSSNNNICVLHRISEIEVIDERGKFIGYIPTKSILPDGQPCRIAINSDNKAWVVTTYGKIVCLQLGC
ncbi:uncharacterized protein LOC134687617 [Mytilus trossulus]|uniref:uncharacterized protein LOC134687617 n=1 Tax=Mytilus trossulus TaxID=6551 RepID=UPI0030051226